MIPQRQLDRVAIVGTSDSWKLAPKDDPTWEIWGVNNLYVLLPKGTRWFEIHNIEFNGKDYIRRDNPVFRGRKVEDYMKDLAGLDIPIMMQRHWDNIPKSEPYPFKEVFEAFPRKYFTNSISWELALAIVMGYKEIAVFGVDMAVGGEFRVQRASVEYFLGYAEAKGVSLYLPAECDLLKTLFMYGLEEKKQTLFEKKIKLHIDSMGHRQQEAQNRFAQAKAEVDQYVGAISATQEISKIWSNLDTDLAILNPRAIKGLD